jgi:hypothetical protein
VFEFCSFKLSSPDIAVAAPLPPPSPACNPWPSPVTNSAPPPFQILSSKPLSNPCPSLLKAALSAIHPLQNQFCNQFH